MVYWEVSNYSDVELFKLSFFGLDWFSYQRVGAVSLVVAFGIPIYEQVGMISTLAGVPMDLR